jgi:hypothetical protein
MESNSQYNTHKQKPSELNLFPTNNAGDDVKVSVQKTLNGLTETLREAPNPNAITAEPLFSQQN